MVPKTKLARQPNGWWTGVLPCGRSVSIAFLSRNVNAVTPSAGLVRLMRRRSWELEIAEPGAAEGIASFGYRSRRAALNAAEEWAIANPRQA